MEAKGYLEGKKLIKIHIVESVIVSNDVSIKALYCKWFHCKMYMFLVVSFLREFLDIFILSCCTAVSWEEQHFVLFSCMHKYTGK